MKWGQNDDYKEAILLADGSMTLHAREYTGKILK